MVAAAFFPTPLWHLLNSSNSFIYAFDLFIPVALLCAIRDWDRAPTRIKTASVLLAVGAGILPVITSLSREGRQDLLWNLVNLYRLLGCLALMIHLSARPRANNKFNSVLLLDCFSVLSIGIFFAMILNGTELMKNDVFTETQNVALGSGDSGEINLDLRFYALGLFRASAGIFGVLGVLPFFVGTEEKKRSVFSAVGAFCGFGAVMLIGSKTSLLTIGALFGVWSTYSLLLKPSLRIIGIVAFFLLISTALLSVFYQNPAVRTYLPPLMVSLLGMEGGVETPTLEYREERWSDTADVLMEGPAAFFGFSHSQNLDYNVSFFHDEYLSVLVLGGVLGLGCYIMGMFLLWQALNRVTSGLPIVEFARLAFLSGIIQAFSVANIQPALLFLNCVAVSCVAYGLAAGYKLPKPIIEKSILPSFSIEINHSA